MIKVYDSESNQTKKIKWF